MDGCRSTEGLLSVQWLSANGRGWVCCARPPHNQWASIFPITLSIDCLQDLAHGEQMRHSGKLWRRSLFFLIDLEKLWKLADLEVHVWMFALINYKYYQVCHGWLTRHYNQQSLVTLDFKPISTNSHQRQGPEEMPIKGYVIPSVVQHNNAKSSLWKNKSSQEREAHLSAAQCIGSAMNSTWTKRVVIHLLLMIPLYIYYWGCECWCVLECVTLKCS